MFTHEGILSKKNLPHGNSLHVCRMALVSYSLEHKITGQILRPAIGVTCKSCQIYCHCFTLCGPYSRRNLPLIFVNKQTIVKTYLTYNRAVVSINCLVY